MFLNAEEVTSDIKKRSIEMSGEIFATEAAPDQMQASEENFEKLKFLDPNTLLYEVIEGDLAAGVGVGPTSLETMEAFLSHQISAQKLLDITEKQDQYPSLYLCAAAVLPQYRRQGIAMKLLKEVITRMSTTKDVLLYAWPTSSEGRSLVEKFKKETGKVIRIRE